MNERQRKIINYALDFLMAQVSADGEVEDMLIENVGESGGSLTAEKEIEQIKQLLGDTFFVRLSKEQMLDLATLTGMAAGLFQDPIHGPRFDVEFDVWHPIAKAISTAVGFESFHEPQRLAHLNLSVNPADVWGNDEAFGREDWQLEVANGDTNLGYWDWVRHQHEEQE